MNKLISLFISILFLFPQVLHAQADEGLDKLCHLYSVHKADADVEYQSGYDIRGEAVAPADLDDGRLETPNVYRIPLHIEQLEALNLQNDSILTPELSVGEVIVDLDADIITFNGQAINQSDLEVLCLEPEYEENPIKD